MKLFSFIYFLTYPLIGLLTRTRGPGGPIRSKLRFSPEIPKTTRPPASRGLVCTEHPQCSSRPPPMKPPPLRFDSSSSPQSSTLLYDLPSAASLSPPNSPLRSSSPARRSTPPPAWRGRPSAVPHSDLEKFSEFCRLWYFTQDEEAGRLMSQTMANLPPSQRAPFSRLQSSMRSAYHRSVNARRTAEFNAHLTATQPGASLTPHARLHINGPAAKKERYERLERFLRSWCTMGMPGPQPFIQSLWAIMRLQVLPENVGGAGRNRIEWQFDDAVFKEAAGKDFMLEAIDLLKGVLGFEEIPFKRRTSTLTGDDPYPDPNSVHSRSNSQPLLSSQKATASQRPRAPSDPFIDRPLGRNPHPPTLSDSLDESPTPLHFDDEDEYLRIWTTPPDIINSEYVSLIKLFPPHITRRSLPYFPITSRSRPLDTEEGYDDEQLRIGTGAIRIGPKQRTDGWEGGWWSRFFLWWRTTFC